MKRRALVQQEYRGIKVEAGEEFDVEQPHIKLLLALGRLAPERGESGFVEPPTPKPAPAFTPASTVAPVETTALQPDRYQTRAMEPDAANDTAQKRPYNRKVVTK